MWGKTNMRTDVPNVPDVEDVARNKKKHQHSGSSILSNDSQWNGTQTFQPYQAAALVAEEVRALQLLEEIKKHHETSRKKETPEPSMKFGDIMLHLISFIMRF